jgi:hypothetical protein
LFNLVTGVSAGGEIIGIVADIRQTGLFALPVSGYPIGFIDPAEWIRQPPYPLLQSGLDAQA